MRERNKNSSRYLVVTVVFVCVLIFLFDFLQIGENIIGNTLSTKETVALDGLYEGYLFPSIFISIVPHINLYRLIFNLLFLVVLGEALNDQYEWLTLLIVLIISGFLGSLVPFLLHSDIVSMGLGGSIFGWIALSAIAYIHFDSKKHLLLSVFVLLIIGTLLVSTLESGEANVLPHIIGFVCRIILGFTLKNVSLIKQKN